MKEELFNLENMLRNASVVDENEIPKDIVSIGTSVKVKDYEFDEEIEFYISWFCRSRSL